MVDTEHLDILKKGVAQWNQWRLENPTVKPNLRNANLSRANLIDVNLKEADLVNTNLFATYLSRADMRKAKLSNACLCGASLYAAKLEEANLRKADFNQANLWCADLGESNLTNADLSYATLRGTDFIGACLRGTCLKNSEARNASFYDADLFEADFSYANLASADFRKAILYNARLIGANLQDADFTEANLTKANLQKANLARSNISNAKFIEVLLDEAVLTDCRVFGIAAWCIRGLEKAEQSNLIITPDHEPIITVDNLEVAQFIYVLLNSIKIRSVIDTITSKVVLILGRFTPERKIILDCVREELRKRNYLPVLFDFDKPLSRDMTETVSTLAHISKFIIADITDSKSVPQELTVIIPNLPSVPVQPILLSSDTEYGMFEHFKRYPWVLKSYSYSDAKQLLRFFKEKVIDPAEAKIIELKDNR